MTIGVIDSIEFGPEEGAEVMEVGKKYRDFGTVSTIMKFFELNNDNSTCPFRPCGFRITFEDSSAISLILQAKMVRYAGAK